MLDGEIEPLVVPKRVGVILDEEHVLLLLLVLEHAVQVPTLETRIEGKSTCLSLPVIA